MYIEDDPASRRLVQRVLDNKGYEVVVAADGLEGISMAREHLPNLILMDINLPSMDGREITTRLRSLPNFSNTPIVALTANHSPGSRELALAAGCTGFLTKPIDVISFPGQVSAYLDGLAEPLSLDEKTNIYSDTRKTWSNGWKTKLTSWKTPTNGCVSWIGSRATSSSWYRTSCARR